MPRLPTPGGDVDTWGTILNDYLGVEHNGDGSHKPLPEVAAHDADALAHPALRAKLPVNAQDHDAAPGKTAAENTTAFQAAADAAGAGLLVVPKGTYSIAGTIACTGMVWFEPGAIIRRTTGVPMFSFTGSKGADVNLTADAVKGSRTLAVDTTGLAAGDDLNLRSNEATGAPSGSTYGEVVRVKSIDSATALTLQAPITRGYTVANTARIAKLTLLPGVGTIGGEFVQDAALTTDVTKGYLSFRLTVDAKVIRPTFRRHEQFAVKFDGCQDWTVENPALHDAIYDIAAPHYAYGIVASGPTQGGEVTGASGRAAQIINAGGTSEGIPRWCTINGRSSGAVGKGAFSLHSDSEQFTLDRCAVYGNDAIGMEIKGNDHNLNRPKVWGAAGVGIYLVPDSATIYPQRVTITEPDVRQIADGAGNIGIGIAVHGTDHVIDSPSVRYVDAYGMNVNVGASAPCSGHTIIDAVVDTPGRDSTFYACIRLGDAVTDTIVRDPMLLNAAKGVDLDGGAANTGCAVINPRGRGVTTLVDWTGHVTANSLTHQL